MFDINFIITECNWKVSKEDGEPIYPKEANEIPIFNKIKDVFQ